MYVIYNRVYTHSPVHISSDEVFFNFLKKPIHSAELQKYMIVPHMKDMLIFIEMKQKKMFEQPHNQKPKNNIFQLHQYPIYNFGTIFKI